MTAARDIAKVSSRQIGAIHALKARLGMDDAVYRAILADETGKRSSIELTFAEAGRVIERLKALAAATDRSPDRAQRNPGAKGAMQLAGPYAAKLRALWIAGYNLGVVHDRSDRALASFIARQTGLSHPRFLIDAGDAARTIEGLKAWLAREAGVHWPPQASADPIALKRCIVFAIGERLAALGEPTPGRFMHCTPEQLDAIAERYGAILRRKLAAQAKRSADA